MPIGSDRIRFFPVEVGADLVRGNVFEVIFNNTTTMTGDQATCLRCMCKTFQVTLPQNNAVQVNWMTGISQYAGRQTNPYQLTATFYVGIRKNTTDGTIVKDIDSFQALYNWRNDVLNHAYGAGAVDPGKIHGAWDYKKDCSIKIYDITGDTLLYHYHAIGLWPTQIQDITLNVEQDTPLELSCTFAADVMYWDKNE